MPSHKLTSLNHTRSALFLTLKLARIVLMARPIVNCVRLRGLPIMKQLRLEEGMSPPERSSSASPPAVQRSSDSTQVTFMPTAVLRAATRWVL